MNPNRRLFLASAAARLMSGATVPAVLSARSGNWSTAATWAGGRVPSPNAKVEIAPGHRVRYDLAAGRFRMIHVLGTLAFAQDRSSTLEVGLIKIGGDGTENGFDHSHSQAKGALEVGTQQNPIPARFQALIRLVHFEGMDPESLPAIVCCGGRMDLHGSPMNRAWLKLGAALFAGDSEVRLSEPVTGWRPGDRVILTATTRQNKQKKTFRHTTRDSTQTEERKLQSIGPVSVMLDRPLGFAHKCDGTYRGEIANLSRNVVIESADPAGVRGHTMYHYGSSGSISYAEFRYLGKRGVLGRYSLHFHQVRDSMRGSSVIGASIWDSDNRWITVHGSDYVLIRDCVGYNSLGHGFFLEDGTEVFNVFDRNLAVQARTSAPLPKQVIPFDKNDGAGFWWANCLNTFTRNVACECDEYGFRFDAAKTPDFDPVLHVPTIGPVDVRTLPFVRFEGNEAHCQRRFAFNLGGFHAPMSGGCGGVGPGPKNPFVIRDMKAWNVHWGFHTQAPCVMLDRFDIHDAEYGFWRPNFDRHAYRGIHIEKIEVHEPEPPVTGVRPSEAEFPGPLSPEDRLAPVLLITHCLRNREGQIVVRGIASDSEKIRSVEVNGRPATVNAADWEVALPASTVEIAVSATDEAGNVAGLKKKI